jgi:hypothetical protein
MVGIKTFEGTFGLFVANTISSFFSSFFSSIFSSEVAEIPMSSSSVDESVEFFLVNNTWVLGVNSLSSLFNPSPLVGGKGMIKGSSDLFNTNFDFFVGKGTVMVGIKFFEGTFSLFVANTLSSLFSSIFSS